MKTKRLLILPVLMFSLMAAEAPKVPVVSDVAANYAKLTLMTPKPVEVDGRLLLLCVGIHRQHVENAAKTTGPHANSAIRIFMNEMAAKAFAEGSKRFPEGSVIVKEKVYRGHYEPAMRHEVKRDQNGVGGMIKRAAGFDPENGDWEYFYFDDVKKLESGKMRACIECHAKAAKTDRVFGQWKRGFE